MKRHDEVSDSTAPGPWDSHVLAELIDELVTLRTGCFEMERAFEADLVDQHPSYRASARNLLHYLALRRQDIREVQKRLASLGLSSLGRTESHVLDNLTAVLKILTHLVGRHWSEDRERMEAVDFAAGKTILHQHTAALLGPKPPRRAVRILVTMPSEAAEDGALIHDLVASGMDCMRINCAHDDPAAWAAMVAHLRSACSALGRDCRVLMDLAGPKLRTGPVAPEAQILKWRPRRNGRGEVIRPARIWLKSCESPEPPPGRADGVLDVPADWCESLASGERLLLTDLRAKERHLTVQEQREGGRWAWSEETAYLDAAQPLELRGADTRPPVEARIRELSPGAGSLMLQPGDRLLVTSDPVPGRPPQHAEDGTLLRPASISCTLPQVLSDVQAGERIWFDDGKIGGIVESSDAMGLRVRITHVPPGGGKLRADKGINLPDSTLTLPGLTAKDVEDLAVVARHADMVGLSFVNRPEDVRALQAELRRLGAEHLGIVLKIETRAGFDRLPSLLLAAMHNPSIGVMIARGDLAVECGYQRLAEVQEEILWMCEAGHVPVIWATEVLEKLAKTGTPSRAEITDAAMGERAECVMLNKGEHLTEAVRVLDDILHRMQAHQNKKRAMLRPLRVSAMIGSDGHEIVRVGCATSS
jgi:pyruvate kinase